MFVAYEQGSLSCHRCYDRKQVLLRTFSYNGYWLVIIIDLKKYSIHMGIATLASRTTFLQCLWPMSREGSLSCHTCYDRKYVFLRTFSYKGLYYKQWLLISYNNRLKEILYWKHPHTQKHHLELYWVGHLFIEQDISYMELYVTLYVRKISEILP